MNASSYRASGDVQRSLSAAAYEELRAIARAFMHSERPGHTLQATALVHEAVIRLQSQDAQQHDPDQLRANTRLMMRRVLANHARDRAAKKRGGGADRARTDPERVPAPDTSQFDDRRSRLERALEALSRTDPTSAALITLRYMRGVPLARAAELMGISNRTASRRLAGALDMLRDAMGARAASEDGDGS